MLLSSILLDGPDLLSRCIIAGITDGSRFYDPKHGIVFDCMMDLYSRQRPISIEIVAEELKKNRQLDGVGGYSFLAQISSKAPTTAQSSYFIEKVREQHLLRSLIRSRTGSVEDCYGFNGDIDQFIADLTAKEQAVTASNFASDEQSVAEAADALLADLGKPPSERMGMAGLCSWGLPAIDLRCGKMAPGDLAVLAGCPSSGKSSIMLQSAWANASDGINVAMFSYEMSKSKLIVRMAQQQSRLNIKKFDMAPRDFQLNFTRAIRAVRDNKHLFMFERDNTVNKVVARVRLMHQRSPIGLVIVDFVQYLARLEPTIQRESMVEKIGRITAALKSLAREINAPVLLLSSLNREGYRDGTRPTMANLKASGEIESDADIVALLHWPKEHPTTGRTQDPHDPDTNEFRCELIQDKGRDSGVHVLPLLFTRDCTRFDAVAPPNA